jgi:hypothetical protein
MDMRNSFVALAFAFAQPVFAQTAPADAIQALIQNQITALQADNFEQAFGFASPTIKGLFGTPQNFGAMVQRGYPMVYRPKAVRMLGLRQEAGLLWQRVMVTDQAGATHLLDYQLVETADGWQINAVQLLPQTGVGV